MSFLELVPVLRFVYGEANGKAPILSGGDLRIQRHTHISAFWVGRPHSISNPDHLL